MEVIAIYIFSSLHDVRYYFHKHDALLLLAGLCETDPDSSEFLSYCVITVNAPQSFAWIHDRMPVVLDEKDLDKWLNPGILHNSFETKAMDESSHPACNLRRLHA